MKKRLIIIICFFSIDDKSVVNDFDFLKEIGTLYDLSIYLFDNSMKIVTSTETQTDFLKPITVLKIIISNQKTDIRNQSEEERKKIFAKQENVLSNAEMLLKKRGELINQFAKNNIISKNGTFFDAPKKSEESISEKEQKSDQSFLKWVQVSKDRFNFIKLKINMNKDLATMIDNKRYTLNDANELVNKIAKQKIGNLVFSNLVDQADQIAKLNSTSHRQKMLEIFNYLGEIFNGPTDKKSPTDGKGLKILTPNQMLSGLQITLTQFKAGNNYEKLKNEIKQLLYSWYRSKKLTKQFYKSLTLFKNGNNLYEH